MKILSGPTSELIAAAVDILRAGGVVAHPTDTVWGLAADATNAEAVAKVHAIKGSDSAKPLLVIIPTKAYLRTIVVVPSVAAQLAKTFWPGPLALMLCKKMPLPAVADAETVGVRYPAHALSRALARGFGRPITTTSANLTGQPTGRSAEELAAIFAHQKTQPDLILDPSTNSGQAFIAPASATPSTIVEVLPGAVGLRVVREGVLPAAEIQMHVSLRS